jgi:Zn-dependent metalloprotease
MKAGTFVVVLAVLAGLFAGVARAGDPTPEQKSALERLRAASSTPVSADFADGTARFVAATVPADGATAADRALSYLDRFRDLYGLGDPRSQLQVVRQAGEGEMQDVFFGESVRGVPVQDAQLGVHLVGGNVVATNGAYLPLLPAGTKPVISSSAAVSIVQKAAGYTDDPVEPPALVYYNASLTMSVAERVASGLDGTTRLAWHVTVPTRGAYVDAQTGRELFAADPVEHVATRMSIRSANNTSPVICWYFGATGWFTQAGQLAGTSPDAEGFAANGFVNNVYDYFRNTHGRLSFDGADSEIPLILDVALGGLGPSINAQYTPWCHHFEFNNNMGTKDVIAHEFTHGVTDFTAHLAGTNQPGALNEHYSDYFAAMIDPDWTIGEGSALGVIRTMSNPPANGDPATMSGFVVTTADNGGVHTNAGIPNKASFLVTDGGLFGGFQIQGLGRTKAERLYFDVLTHLLPSNANFIDQRNMTVVDATVWASTGKNGFTPTNACNVRNAFAAVELGDGDADCDGLGDSAEADDDGDGVLDGGDNCPKVSNASQTNTDGDATGNACDLDDDNDTVVDASDNCVLVANTSQKDTDGDGLGDACDSTPTGDADADGVDNAVDNCKWHPNPDQRDDDHDGIGNVCDTDYDNDTVQNSVDNCPWKANTNQLDTDKDGKGDVCDNAPNDFNPDQADTDKDGIADVVDPDDDNDGVLDGSDNCPLNANPKQEDSNGNGAGDACEYVISPDHDIHDAFKLRDKYFERFQIIVNPCILKCGPFGELLKSSIRVDSEYKLELRLLDARGEVVAHGLSSEPLDFETTIGENGLPPQFTLEILPSPEFEPGSEYGFTAGLLPGGGPTG